MRIVAGIQVISFITPSSSPLNRLLGCALQECLRDFTSIERVSDVECRNCTLAQAKEYAEGEMRLQQHAIESMERKMNGSDTQG